MGFGIKEKIVGGVVAGGIAIFGGVSSMDDKTVRDESGSITEAGGVGAFVLKVGDCIMAPEEEAELIASVEGVPCAKPHDAQVFALFDVPDGDFDVARIEDQALEGCVARFEGAISRSLDNATELDGTFMSPSEESWAQDDHEIVCLVVSADGSQLTASALPS